MFVGVGVGAGVMVEDVEDELENGGNTCVDVKGTSVGVKDGSVEELEEVVTSAVELELVSISALEVLESDDVVELEKMLVEVRRLELNEEEEEGDDDDDELIERSDEEDDDEETALQVPNPAWHPVPQ
jgi:hypothetical protein